ncbi:hypothetical protein BKA70DRAFT_1437460 [Coprinopsis sp. MPI-PUGE-AT-0042]|nr:hypothetical protein BKA70DRAFT_1437460 [Coprinopsis sp. MPI-PUGE-AT-0042]
MRGGEIRSLQVNGIDIISSKQVVQYACYWAIDQANGPLVLESVTHRYGGHSYVLPSLRPSARR